MGYMNVCNFCVEYYTGKKLHDVNVGYLDALPEHGTQIDPESYQLCGQYQGISRACTTLPRALDYALVVLIESGINQTIMDLLALPYYFREITGKVRTMPGRFNQPS